MTENHPLIGKIVINPADGGKSGTVLDCAYHQSSGDDWAGYILLVVLEDHTIIEWIATDCVGAPA